ncbi:hypothetical protein [Streptomyces sp. NPDC056049]|uniref:hypothetical protein n=1 Tax=Streptomyces sp. NPDC056049 TaxID=3345693 RepID=UPI0035DB20D1
MNATHAALGSRSRHPAENAQRHGKRYGIDDVLLFAEVVSVSSACKDCDDRTAKCGLNGIRVYLAVDPYAAEALVHGWPTGSGCIAVHTHKYGSGKLPDERAYTLDLDELPWPESDTR